MVAVPASLALEPRLVRTVGRLGVPALGTLLRRVGGRHLDHEAAVARRLLLEQRDELAPPHLQDAPVEPTLLRHVDPGFLDRARGRPHHARDRQVLDDDHAVVLGVAVGEGVQQVVSLPPHLAMDGGELRTCLGAVLRPLLFAAEVLVGPGDLRLTLVKEDRTRFEMAKAVGHEVGHAAVEPHRLPDRRRRVGDLEVAHDRGEPLVTVTGDRGRGALSFERSVQHDGDVAELGEDQHIAAVLPVEPPDLLAWFAQPDRVVSLGLEVRAASALGEALLPGPVESLQHVLAHVRRHVLEPVDLGAQLRGFLFLVVEGRRAPVDTCSGEAHQALFVGEIPEPAQGALPADQASGLFGARVDPVAEGASDLHDPFSLSESEPEGHRHGEQGGRRLSEPRRSLLPSLKEGGCRLLPRHGHVTR